MVITASVTLMGHGRNAYAKYRRFRCHFSLGTEELLMRVTILVRLFAVMRLASSSFVVAEAVVKCRVVPLPVSSINFNGWCHNDEKSKPNKHVLSFNPALYLYKKQQQL